MYNTRRGRVPLSKQFVAGGVYDGNNANKSFGVQQQQQLRQQVLDDVKDVIEVEPQPALVQENNNIVVDTNETNDDAMDANEGKQEKMTIFKKFFMKRKKSSVRLKEKKLRQNRQLRKAITPKNALMALNEVKGVSISDFIIVNANNSTFNATVTVNNKQYEGIGSSKVAAKNDACEKALRDYVIEKMRRFPRYAKQNQNAQGEPMDEDEHNEEGNANNENEQTGAHDDSEDVPMVNLASFALFKLFSNWESEGYEIPELHPASHNMSSNISNGGSENGSVAVKEPNKPPIRNELPNDWENLHPATLLCMMRPGLNYYDSPSIVDKDTGVLQAVYVTVDGTQFNGIGRSKKIARRNAAIDACNQLFGTNFTKVE